MAEKNSETSSETGKKREPVAETVSEKRVEKEKKTTKVKKKKETKKKDTTSHLKQQSITEHFPVRRSSRKCKSDIEKEKFSEIVRKLKEKDEEGLKVVEIDGKGRGVIATRNFTRGELLCEYSGELITFEEAKKREEEYEKDTSIGCYMYYFDYDEKKMCVDATKDNGRYGRLVNHSRKSNVQTKLIPVDNHPYLCLLANKDIAVDEELLYDYGERKKEIIESHPWLTS